MHHLTILMISVVVPILGCQATSTVQKPDYGISDYANYHERDCRPDIDDICVETDVGLDEATIRSLADIAVTHHTSNLGVAAVRLDQNMSVLLGLPTIQVVSGAYHWTISGARWDANEEASRFVWRNDEWEYLETFEIIYDPV
jgi:hypothetical protein